MYSYSYFFSAKFTFVVLSLAVVVDLSLHTSEWEDLLGWYVTIWPFNWVIDLVWYYCDMWWLFVLAYCLMLNTSKYEDQLGWYVISTTRCSSWTRLLCRIQSFLSHTLIMVLPPSLLHMTLTTLIEIHDISFRLMRLVFPPCSSHQILKSNGLPVIFQTFSGMYYFDLFAGSISSFFWYNFKLFSGNNSNFSPALFSK